MVDFTGKFQRFDLYRDFRYRLRIDGRYIAGFSKMSTLKPKPALLRRLGNEAIVFEGGATHDLGFQTWAQKTLNSTQGQPTKAATGTRKNLVIEVYNEKGQFAAAYRIIGGWVSEYTGLPDLEANANAVAIQHITIENEGWEQDTIPGEPTEPPS
jgi:phage tail-like protein